MLERRRCHPLYIVERLFSVFGAFGILIFSMVVTAMEDVSDVVVAVSELRSVILYIVLFFIVLTAIVALFTWIGWRNIWISAEDNTLIYESGVLVKRRVTIPFSKINTIDMGRNLFQRLLGTCRLKIDTGAKARDTENTSQMNIVFSLKDAEEFRNFILNRAAQDEEELRKENATAITASAEPRWVVRAKFTDFLLYGLTSSSVAKLFGTVIIVLCFLAEISSSIIESAVDAVTPYAQSFWHTISGSGILMLILFFIIIFFGISLFANAVSVAYAAIRFYGFRVAREGDNVVVRYGLITEKNYTVQAENVHAVIIRQNLFQQIIGRCSVEMVSIGFGNESNETNLLFPIIQKKKLGWLIDTLLPEYSLSVEEHKPEKRSVRFIIVRPIIWAALFLAAALVVCHFIMKSIVGFAVAAVLILLLVIVNSILKYRNTAIGSDKKVMMTRSGGMRVTSHLIRIDAVQSISSTSGIFQRPRKVANFHVDFHAPQLQNIATVPNMNAELIEELDDNLFF